ncbi:type VI secretion system Vgr family protein [Thalassotalea ganghwensis]
MSVSEVLTNIVASESQFSLSVEGVPTHLFAVTDMASVSDELCQDYQFTVDVLTEELVSAEQVIGKNATFTIVWGLADRTISGIVSQLLARGQSHQGYHYTVTLNSPLILLHHKRSNRVFTELTIEEILTKVFEKSGFPMECLDIKAQGPKIDMLVQYNETDLAFVDRVMRKYGMVYGVIEQNGKAVVTITNDSSAFVKASETLDLAYQAPTGTVRASESIFAISKKSQLLINDVELFDYRNEFSETYKTATTNNMPLAGAGKDQRYGENYRGLELGELFATTRQQALDCQRQITIIDSDCRAIRPGMLVNIVDHPEYQGSYFVIRVDHVASQAGAVNYGSKVKGLLYKNQAHLIPADVSFKAFVPDSRRVYTTFSATIEKEMDAKGDYIVRLPFNQDGEGEESKRTRMAQPYGGAGHGMNFPLTKGTEVIVCGENGDLDRPIILGAMYNEHAPSPVTAHNSHENIIKSRAGHQLIMDDKAGEAKISLQNRHSANSLVLDATDGAHQATLSSKGSAEVSAQGYLSFQSGQDTLVTAGSNINLSATNAINMTTAEGDISVQAAKDIQAKAGANIALEATENNIDVSAEKALNLQAKQDISWYSEQGNVSLQANQGDLEVNAGGNIVIQSTDQGSISISQGSGSIEIDAGGNLTIDANNITLSAANIVIKGNAVSNN